MDAAMAVMLMLLTAVDEGVGAWWFGVFHGAEALLRDLGVPPRRRLVGGVAPGRAARRPPPARRRRGHAPAGRSARSCTGAAGSPSRVRPRGTDRRAWHSGCATPRSP